MNVIITNSVVNSHPGQKEGKAPDDQRVSVNVQYDHVLCRLAVGLDTEGLDEHIGHVRSEEHWKPGAEHYVLNTQFEKNQQNQDGLLLIPAILNDNGRPFTSVSNASARALAMTTSE